MHTIGYIASVLIGISLGMAGSGGSILTVPVLVYLMSVNPLVATTSSLFIVGSTSLVGGIKAYLQKMVVPAAVIEFGVPSILSIFITRRYLLPALPLQLFTIGGFTVSKDMFLMIAFAILMIAASVSMIHNKRIEPAAGHTTHKRLTGLVPVVLLGLLVGVVTGFLGAGGGFLIIPSLVLFLKLPMKMSIGTSLFIIGINSLLGFVFSLNQFEYDWSILLPFTALAIAGIFIGNRLAGKISGALLKKGFGWFILAMGAFIIIRESFGR